MTILVDVTDNIGVKNVNITIDGVEMEMACIDPEFSDTWSISYVPQTFGRKTFSIKAKDTDGHISEKSDILSVILPLSSTEKTAVQNKFSAGAAASMISVGLLLSLVYFVAVVDRPKGVAVKGFVLAVAILNFIASIALLIRNLLGIDPNVSDPKEQLMNLSYYWGSIMGALLSTLLLLIFTSIAGIGLKGAWKIPEWLKKLNLGLGLAALLIKALEFFSSFFMGQPWPTGGVIAWLFGPEGPWTTPGGLTWTIVLPILIAGGIGVTTAVIAFKSKIAEKLMVAFTILSFSYALLGFLLFDYNYLDTIGSAFTS